MSKRLWCPVRRRHEGWIRNIWHNRFPVQGVVTGKLTFIEKVWMTLLLGRGYLSLGYFLRGLLVNKNTKEKREKDVVEIYMILRLVLFGFLLLSCHWSLYGWFKSRCCEPLLWFPIGYLITGCVLHPLRIVFVDRYNPCWRPHTFNRRLIFTFVSYTELLAAFAFLYWRYGVVGFSDSGKPIATIGQALYFSAITITTLGYGDIHPIKWQGRFLAFWEPIMGIVLLVVVIGIFFVELGRKQR